MSEIFLLSWRDFWTKKFISLSILPLICSVCVLGIGLFWAASELGEMLTGALSSGDFGLFDLSGYPWIMKILNYGVVHWLFSAMFYAIGSYFMLMLSIVIALFIAGFFTPIVASEINARHYNSNFTPISTARSVSLMSGVLLRFLGLMLVCLPMIFLPFVNFLIINVPFFYLYERLMLIDVGSNTLSREKFELAWLGGGEWDFKLACALFYLISLVPILGLLGQLFFIIFLSHLMLRRDVLRKF